MAKAINNYKIPLDSFGQLQFTTLTAPLVHVTKIGAELKRRKKHWHNIRQTLSRQGIKVSGLFKSETVLKKGGWVNLHFHILHDKSVGDRIINEWRKRMPMANYKGQDTREATQDSLMEIIKYQTKAFSKETKGDTVILHAGNPKHLDILYQQLKGQRILQPFGDLRKHDIGEDVEGVESELQCAYDVVDNWIYRHTVKTWVNDSGEMLVEPKGIEKVELSFKSSNYGN
jgi:hypothetical protein